MSQGEQDCQCCLNFWDEEAEEVLENTLQRLVTIHCLWLHKYAQG